MQTLFAASTDRSSLSNLVRGAVLALLGSALLAISAKVQVIWPVPMTMQTLVVLLMGAHGGSRLAGATVLAYLVEGASGLPVFSTGAGLAFMAGPTGGYLAGFLVAALLAGYAFERGYARTLLGALAVFIVADSVIIGLGFAWLSVLFGAEKALAVGVLPFLLPEALKIALAVASVPVAQAFFARKARAE
jgi:biotin transport system substrate-specific component